MSERRLRQNHSSKNERVSRAIALEDEPRFKYNPILQYVMQDFLGEKHYAGMAGAFRSPIYCRECLLKAVKKIRKRLDEISTMDERLREETSRILGNLEADAKGMSEKVNNDWLIITNLLHLIAHLLGYDWRDGKVHRHIFFFQDKQQEKFDKINEDPKKYYDNWHLDGKLRYKLVSFLEKHQIQKHQIARLLGISVKRVNNILLRIGEYEKETSKRFPSFEEEK